MNKWALVTGGAGGIGAAIANILARDGFNLILVDLAEGALQDAKEHISSVYPTLTIHLYFMDLSQEKSANQLYEAVKEKKIDLDILVNNAGFGTLGFFQYTDWEREKKMIRLHVETLTQLTKLFLNDMLEQRSGKILNVASVAGFLPSPLMAVYNASKAYVLSFSQAIANEVSGSGVTITVLCPGLTRTGFQSKVGVGNPDFTRNGWLSDHPESVAALAVHGMYRGKIVIIPGWLNKTLIFIQRFLPRSLTTKLVRKIQEKNRRFLTPPLKRQSTTALK